MRASTSFGYFATIARRPLDEGVVAAGPAGNDGLDIEPLEFGCLFRNRCQFAGALCGIRGPGIRSDAVVAVQQLKTGAEIARRCHRDSPLRHRGLGIEFGRLAEGSLRLDKPERVHLRHALIKELLRVGTSGGDWEVNGAHAVHQLRGQRGGVLRRLRSARVTTGFVRTLRGDSTDAIETTRRSFMAHPLSVGGRSDRPVGPLARTCPRWPLRRGRHARSHTFAPCAPPRLLPASTRDRSPGRRAQSARVCR